MPTCERCENLATLMYKGKVYCHWHYPGMLNYAEKLPGIRHIYIRVRYPTAFRLWACPLPDQSSAFGSIAVHEERQGSHQEMTDPVSCSASVGLNRSDGKDQCSAQKAARELDEDHVTSSGQPDERRRLRRPLTGRKFRTVCNASL